MARGTHLRTTPLTIRKGNVDPVDAEVCDVRMNRGDALFFENRIFHTAAPNRNDRVFKGIDIWLCLSLDATGSVSGNSGQTVSGLMRVP